MEKLSGDEFTKYMRQKKPFAIGAKSSNNWDNRVCSSKATLILPLGFC